MKNVAWRSIDGRELATLLKNSPRVAASAAGATTVYRLEHNEREILVVAAPGGTAVVVEQAPRPARRRRQLDRAIPASR